MLTNIEIPKSPEAARQLLGQWRREGIKAPEHPVDEINRFVFDTAAARMLIFHVAVEDYDLTGEDEPYALWRAATTLREEGERLVMALWRHDALESAEQLLSRDETRRILRTEVV